MNPWLVAFLFAASLAGFCALSLAMDRHCEDVFGRGSSPGAWRRWLQLAGTLLLCLSLAGSLQAGGSAIGWVLWFGALTVAAWTTVALINYLPKRMPWVGVAAAVVALPGLLAFAVAG